ncbi:MAG: hypothetical protein PVJ33_00445 [Lysobacterales bacterium]|jgi:hypothetical protein
MRASYTTLLAGVLALVFCGTAIAHDSGYYQPSAGGQLSGTVVVWSVGQGYSGWSGSLSYGLPPGYRPGYIAWAPHRHVQGCRHPGHFAPPRHGYERAYRKGYRDGHRNGRGHSHHH